MFLISILLTKVTGDIELISHYEKLLLLTTAFSFFWVSGLNNTVIPFYERAEEEVQKKTLFNTYIVFVVLSLVTVAAMIWASLNTASAVERDLIQLYSIYVFLNIPSYLIEYIYIVKHRLKNLVAWGTVSFGLQIVAVIIPLTAGYGLKESIYCLIGVAVLRYIILFIILKKHQLFEVDKALIKQFMLLASPMIVALLLGGGLEHLNGFIVDWKLDDEAFAIYRYGGREFPLFLILANSVSNIMSGKIAAGVKNDNLGDSLLELKNAARKLIVRLFPLAILFIFISKPLFYWVYNEAIGPGYMVFNILLLLLISRLLFPQTVLLGMHRNKVFYLTGLAELVIGGGLALFLVDDWGVSGVAAALAIAYFIEKILLIAYCSKLGIKPSQYIPLREWFLLSVLLIGAFAASCYAIY